MQKHFTIKYLMKFQFQAHNPFIYLYDMQACQNTTMRVNMVLINVIKGGPESI